MSDVRVAYAERNGGPGPYIVVDDPEAIEWLRYKLSVAKPGDVFTLTISDVPASALDNSGETDFDD